MKFEFDSLSNAAELFKAAMLALNLKLEYWFIKEFYKRKKGYTSISSRSHERHAKIAYFVLINLVAHIF